jgi:hypothetical protein
MRLVVLLALAGAATAQAPSSYKPFGVLADVMQSILLPNSEVVFGVTRTAPKNDMEWANVESSAAVLAESGNLLLMRGRLRENGKPVPVQSADWKKRVQALVDSAKGAHKAAQSKDPEAVFVACEPLYQACFGCHQAYRFCPTCPEAAPPEK